MSWLEALTERTTTNNGADLGGAGLYNIRDALTEGQQSPRVTSRLAEALTALYSGGCRHDQMLGHVLTLLRLGKRGESGVKPALQALREAFANNVGPERADGRAEALREFNSMVTNKGAAKLLAERDLDDWMHQDEPPPDADDHHAGEWAGPAGDDAPAGDTTEALIQRRLEWLRVNNEAKRRLEDEQHPRPPLPAVKSLDALLDEPDTDVPYRIDKVAPAEARIILSAQKKAGKTTLRDNLIRSLADGDDFLGKSAVNTRPGGIALIDNELSENTGRRWLRDQDIYNTAAVVDVVHLRGQLGAFNPLDDRCRTEWTQRFKDLGADYLILDCLRPILDALGLDESHDAGKFLVAFDALLTEAGIGDAALVHHMGHTGERARGDSRIEDWPDAIWHLNREDPNKLDSPRFFSAFGRDVNVSEGRLAFDEETRRLTYVAGSRSDAKLEAAVIALIWLLADIAKNDKAPLSKSAIEDELCPQHALHTVRKAITNAEKRGLVTIDEGPRRAKYPRITHPCGGCGFPVGEAGGRHLNCPNPGDPGLDLGVS